MNPSCSPTTRVISSLGCEGVQFVSATLRAVAHQIGGLRTYEENVYSFHAPSCFCFSASAREISRSSEKDRRTQTGTLEKMIVAKRNVTMDLDLNRLNGVGSKESKLDTLRFQAEPNSFFPSSFLTTSCAVPCRARLALIQRNSAILPEALKASSNQLVRGENAILSEPFEFVVRDEKTGFVFFNIEGHSYDYNAASAFAPDQRRKALDFGRVCEESWDAPRTLVSRW